MFASRFARFLAFALVAAAIPACGRTKVKPPPAITRATPTFDANGVSYFPLMVLEFDRALDPTTVNTTNITINLTVALTGAPAAPWGGSYSVTYLPGSFQVLVTTTTAFTASTEYTVLIYPQLLSSEGVPIEAAASGGEALRFVVGSAANTNQPSFSAPTQAVGGASGQIVWTWSQAQEAAAVITATYEFYMSLTSESEDMLANPPFVSRTDATGFTMGAGGTAGNNVTLTPGVQYFFRMIVRDSAGNIIVTAPFSGTANP